MNKTEKLVHFCSGKVVVVKSMESTCWYHPQLIEGLLKGLYDSEVDTSTIFVLSLDGWQKQSDVL